MGHSAIQLKTPAREGRNFTNMVSPNKSFYNLNDFGVEEKLRVEPRKVTIQPQKIKKPKMTLDHLESSESHEVQNAQ